MSRLKCSVQVSAPGSFATPAPMCLVPCQMPKTAPAGSTATAIRPMSMTSIGAAATVPPAWVIFRAVASASSLAR